MEPTQEQIKEFWERYGYTGKLAGIEDIGEREGKLVYVYPPIDLNNLFKYAVPKLEAQKFRMMITYNNIKRPNKEYMYRVSFCKFKTNSWGKAYDKDPALALFWALKEIE